MQFLLFNWYCNENENYGIIIARSAIQGDKSPCAAEAAIIPVPHGLKSKCPYGCFLFFAHGIMIANTI